MKWRRFLLHLKRTIQGAGVSEQSLQTEEMVRNINKGIAA